MRKVRGLVLGGPCRSFLIFSVSKMIAVLYVSSFLYY